MLFQSLYASIRSILAVVAIISLASCGGSTGGQGNTNPNIGGSGGSTSSVSSTSFAYEGTVAPRDDDVQNFLIYFWVNVASSERCGACHGCE